MKAGAGTLTLSNANTYTGTTRVSAGVLQLGASGVLADSSSLSIEGGTLAVGDKTETVAGFILVSGQVTGTTGQLISTTTFAVQSGIIVVALGGSVGLTKSTSGTVILTGNSTYSGATLLSGGTLVVDGSTSSASSVTVQSNGTLAGTGTINGSVTVTGGTIAPGSSPGILHSGSVVFDSNSMFRVEINGTTAGSQHDRLDITGTANLGGAILDPSLSGYTPTAGDTIVLLRNHGGDSITGTFKNKPEGSTVTIGAFTFVIS